MRKPARSPLFILIISSLILIASPAFSQVYDTITNWDGIAREWTASTPGAAVVQNPAPDPVNESGHCYKFITGEGMYDYMYTMLDEPANFDTHPRYKLKVLAPESGGNILLKFENYDNSSSQEIWLTPVPGQWTDLEYDFTGLPYNDYVRMVIFPDFEGIEPGNAWYIDDVLREHSDDPGPLDFESNLPLIIIDTYGVPIEDEPKITAHMGVVDNGPGQMNRPSDPFTTYDGFIGIERRGQSSQMFPKNSYAVETRDSDGENLDTNLLGLPKENDWVFYAPYSDKSLLRQVMSFEMGRKMGMYASRSRFFELIINDDYKGIYTLMEKIKPDNNRVDIAKINPDEISGDDLTGGYMVKVDKIDWDFQLDVDGWLSVPDPAYPNAMNIIFQHYYPEKENMVYQQRDYIRNFITTAENSLTIYYFSNPYLGYQQYFDVLSFIDMMLLSEIPKEVDKYRYSTYFYKDKDSDGGKLFAGPPWDFDLGYGNVDYWEPGLETTGWLYEMVEANNWSIMFWWKRLMEDPYFRDMAKSRWAYLRANELSNSNIQSMIDSVLTLTADAKDRNFERWPIIGQYVWPNYDWQGNNYEDEVDYVHTFLFNRLFWMDQHMDGNIVNPIAGISATDNMITIILTGDYFCDPVLKKKHFTLNNAPPGTVIDSVIFVNISECQLLLNSSVASQQDLTVTIEEQEINYWLDITSSPLSAEGVHDPGPVSPDIRVHAGNHFLHIYTDKPELLSDKANIYNIAGQLVMTVSLMKNNENIIPVELIPGLYILTINLKDSPFVAKFSFPGD
jgi:hypothetical protein